MKKAPPPVTAPKPYKAPGSTNTQQHYTGLPNYRPIVYKNPEDTGDASTDLPLPPPPTELLHPHSEHAHPPAPRYAPSQQDDARIRSQLQQQTTAPAVHGSAAGESEAEVDMLTSLLMKSMDAASHPDFYGMCAVCGQKVLGDKNGCTALDKMYHVTCFTCVSCGTALNDKPFFETEKKHRCEPCYTRTLEQCVTCHKPIMDRLVRACGKPHHPDCFRCTSCSAPLDTAPFSLDPSGANIHCLDCYNSRFGPRCSACQQTILPSPGQHESVRVVALDRDFHVACFKCEDCGRPLSSEEEAAGCYPLDGHLLCKGCNARRIQRLS